MLQAGSGSGFTRISGFKSQNLSGPGPGPGWASEISPGPGPGWDSESSPGPGFIIFPGLSPGIL